MGVEAEGGLAIGGQGDDAAVAVQLFQFLVNHLIGSLLQPHALEGDQIADLAGHAQGDEVFASAGGGDGAGFVGCVGSRADDGRVADAARHFGLQTAGRGSGCNVAGPVERNHSHGAMADWLLETRPLGVEPQARREAVACRQDQAGSAGPLL